MKHTNQCNMTKNSISVASVSKVTALLASIIMGWIFLTTQLVNANDYYKDSLSIQESLVEIRMEIVGDRLDTANRLGDVSKADKLERRLASLEQKHAIIADKKLSK